MNRKYYDRDRHLPLARAYVPFQRLDQVYEPGVALRKGTLFPELYMPYKRSEDNDGGRYYD